MSFTDLLTIRDTDIDGVKDWIWIKEDDGLWQGPMENWCRGFSEAYRKYTRKQEVVVQAGGGCGMYPRLLSDIFQTVYTFEPDPLSFHCLVNNCQKNNIIKINAALGDCHKMITVRIPVSNNRGMNTVYESEQNIIPQLMIDDLVLNECDMILLDTEGYEERALIGARNTIEKLHPLIVVENANSPIRDMMKSLDYKELETLHADTFFRYGDI